jgi:AcrR family transcriptional regulator
MATTRDRLVAAANESFRRCGYHGTSLKDVTEGAGATIGSLYHFFPGGKEALTVAAMTTSGEAYRQLFEVIADAAPDPATAIRDFFEGAAIVLAESGYIDPCPIGTVAREVANTSEAIRTATALVFRSWIETVAARFEAAGLTEDHAEALATTVIAALEGGFVLARAQRDSEPLLRVGRSIHRLAQEELAARQPHALSHGPSSRSPQR